MHFILDILNDLFTNGLSSSIAYLLTHPHDFIQCFFEFIELIILIWIIVAVKDLILLILKK